MKFLSRLMKNKKQKSPQYGWAIFQQKTWLTKQVEDAQHKAAQHQILKIK